MKIKVENKLAIVIMCASFITGITAVIFLIWSSTHEWVTLIRIIATCVVIFYVTGIVASVLDDSEELENDQAPNGDRS